MAAWILMTPTLLDTDAAAPACPHTAGVINSAATTGNAARIFILTPYEKITVKFSELEVGDYSHDSTAWST
jgi:hypothetical protein